MPRLWNSVDASGGSERVPKVRLDPAQFLLAQFRPPVANLTSSSAKVFTPLSIPADMPEMPFQWTSTYSSWLQIINSATSSIDIACYYMTLTDGSVAPPGQGGYMGSSIFQSLVAAAHNRGVRIRIVQQLPDARMPAYDTGNLTAMGLATVRSIDFSTIMGGIGGILHTKMMIVDGKHGYVGSANLGTAHLYLNPVSSQKVDLKLNFASIPRIFEGSSY
jgi:phosphatidylserine/phosphatidylglycerophosphate/cardiolipin synthase-like enzyme